MSKLHHLSRGQLEARPNEVRAMGSVFEKLATGPKLRCKTIVNNATFLTLGF